MAVFRVPKQDTDNFYIIQTKWQSDGLSVIVIDSDLAWTGQLTNTEIKSLGNCVGKNESEYLAELQCALSGEHKNNFCYLIEDEKLIVKKLDHKTHIKIRFGTIKLEKVPAVSMYTLLLTSILQEVSTNKIRIKELEKEVNTLKTEQTNLKQMFSSCVAEKTSLEATLYTQFLKILNAKKEKISDPVFEDADNPSLRKTEGVNCKGKRTAVFGDKRKFKLPPTADVFEHTDSDVSAAKPTETVVPSTSRQGKEQTLCSNHYDSDTDIDDTDDDAEIKRNNPEPKNPPPVLELSADSPNSPSPKKILPKRVRGCKRPIQIPEEPSEVSEEFNSQSLLDDFNF